MLANLCQNSLIHLHCVKIEQESHYIRLEKPNEAWVCDNLTSYNLNEVALLADISSLAIFIIDLIDTIIDVTGGDLPDFIYKDDKKVNYDGNIVSTIILEQAMTTIHKKDSNDRRYYHNYLEGALRNVMKKLFNDVENPDLPTDFGTAIKLLFQFILFIVRLVTQITFMI